MIQAMAREVSEQVRRVMAGKEQVILWCLAAVLARGHILLEDIPGVGKTSLAVALAKVLGMELGRVQFTCDVMPADVVGYSVLKNGEMLHRPGPVQCNLFLADELNRATSRTQSALLEAMEEKQVTVDGICYPLPEPFVVIATQNPLGGAGTQPLPDSLQDRFFLRLRMGYPPKEEEKKMVLQRCVELQQITTVQELLKMQEAVADTYVKETVADYAVRLVAMTRKMPFILRGASPRATLSVMALSKARAQLQGRDFVIPEDVREAFCSSLSHRVLTRGYAQSYLHWLGRAVRPPKMK